MSYFSGKPRAIIAGVALLGLATLLVFIISPWEDSMTPEQARTQVANIVDGTLERAAPDYTPAPTSSDGSTGTCYDRFGGTADANNLSYSREIFGFESSYGDEIAARTEQFWREEGLSIEYDNRTPGVTTIYGRVEGGFSYELIVNRNDQRAAVLGMTPCFSKQEWAEAEIT